MARFNVRSSSYPTTEVDLSNMPARHNIKGSVGLGIFLCIFSSFFIVFPMVGMFSIISKEGFSFILLVMLLFPVFGSLFLHIGLDQIFRKGIVIIRPDYVEMDLKTVGKKIYWREFLNKYKGVLYRSEYHSGGKNSSSYTLYIVELYHDNKDRIVTLYESRSKQGIREKWENYARVLGLSALEKVEGKIVSRDVEDLDKSVADLVKEDKIQVEEVILSQPPKDIDVKQTPTITTVSITKKGMPIAAVIFMIVFPLIFVGIGFFAKGAFIFGLVGLVFEAIMIAIIVFSFVATPQLRFGNDYVEVTYITPWQEVMTKRLAKGSIEQVKIKSMSADNSRANSQNSLYIESDAGVITFGYMLPKETLQWLKNCVIKLIS